MAWHVRGTVGACLLFCVALAGCQSGPGQRPGPLSQGSAQKKTQPGQPFATNNATPTPLSGPGQPLTGQPVATKPGSGQPVSQKPGQPALSPDLLGGSPLPPIPTPVVTPTSTTSRSTAPPLVPAPSPTGGPNLPSAFNVPPPMPGGMDAIPSFPSGPSAPMPTPPLPVQFSNQPIPPPVNPAGSN